MPDPRQPDYAERHALKAALEKATWDSTTRSWTLKVTDDQYRAMLEHYGSWVERDRA